MEMKEDKICFSLPNIYFLDENAQSAFVRLCFQPIIRSDLLNLKTNYETTTTTKLRDNVSGCSF